MKNILSQNDVSEIIQMALSDHVSFKNIMTLYGLNEDKVKKIMKKNLKFGSYKAWRKRVRNFSNRRMYYK